MGLAFFNRTPNLDTIDEKFCMISVNIDIKYIHSNREFIQIILVKR